MTLSAFVLPFPFNIIWGFVQPLWAFLKSLPWWVYAAVAVVAFHFVDRSRYAARQVEAAVAEAREEWRVAEERRQESADAIARAKFDDLEIKTRTLHRQAEERLQQQEKDSAAQLAALKGRLNAYVSPLRLAAFPELPRGFVRYAADAAAFANGGPAAAGGAPAKPDDEPSGVSLAAWADYVTDQASAFRACTRWGAGWRDYAGRLKAQCESTIQTLQGATP